MIELKNDSDLLRVMWRVRLFEEKLDHLFSEGKLDGTTHLAAGQEATAVGACAALGPEDYIVSNHRGHGHLIARGGEPRRIMAEVMGKRGGYCAGKGGSQHMCAMDIGFLGTNGITAGGLPIATGAAFAIKYRGEPKVVLCFFGDGATNQGVFHESLNMASLWDLPVVFFCENNLYAMSMPICRTMKVANIADRAAAYAMPGAIVDGMDVHAVIEAARLAVERARSGGGPTLIEARTYRYYGHSKSDRRVYRTREEEAQWHERDPINNLTRKMISAGAAENELDGIRREEERLIDQAVEFAAQSEPMPAAEALKGVCPDE